MEFDALAPPSIPKDEPYATNESSMNDYYSFAQVLLSLPSIENIGYNLT